MESVFDDLHDQVSLIAPVGVKQTALKNTASMLIRRDFDAVLRSRRKYMLQIKIYILVSERCRTWVMRERRHGPTHLIVLHGETLQAPQNDVMAVEVLDEDEISRSEDIDDGLNLLVGCECLYQSLNRPGSMVVERHPDELERMRRECPNSPPPLIFGAHIEELLHEIIGKRIHHQLRNVTHQLPKYHLDVLRPFLVELALQETTTLLVLRDKVNAPSKIRQTLGFLPFQDRTGKRHLPRASGSNGIIGIGNVV